jgi:glycosyltransferase involved in cell wall biosynthesis
MKDQPGFVRAARLVADRMPSARCILAGRGVPENAELRGLIRQLHLDDVVVLQPEVTDTPRFLASVDIAVSASYSEAFPNVVGEAMACGTPCVVTDVGESAMIVGDCGIVVPPRQPAALAEGVLALLNMPQEERRALGSRARRRILEHFSLASVVQQYERLYERLAAGSQMAPSLCAE